MMKPHEKIVNNKELLNIFQKKTSLIYGGVLNTPLNVNKSLLFLDGNPYYIENSVMKRFIP